MGLTILRRMTRLVATVLVVALAACAGCGGDSETDAEVETPATGSPGKLRVLASKESSYTPPDTGVSHASVSLDTDDIGARTQSLQLFFRGYGPELSGDAYLTCSRLNDPTGVPKVTKIKLERMKPGKLYRLERPFRGSCFALASVSGSGRIRVEIVG